MDAAQTSSDSNNGSNNPQYRRPQFGPHGRSQYGFYGNPMMNFMMPGMSGGVGDGNPLITSLQYLQGLSYVVYSLGQMFDMIGMNASSIYQGYLMIYSMIQKLVLIAKNSSFRKWMQTKSKKSRIVRYLFVALSMVATYSVIHLFHTISVYLEQSQNLIADIV